MEPLPFEVGVLALEDGRGWDTGILAERLLVAAELSSKVGIMLVMEGRLWGGGAPPERRGGAFYSGMPL